MPSFKFKLIFINQRGFDGNTHSFQELIETSFERNYRNNLGVNVFIKNIEILDGEIATLCFWDISEKEIFKFFRKSLYRGATGVVIAFDLSDLESYERTNSQIQEIRSILGREIPYVLIGVNKGKINDQLDMDELTISAEQNGGIFIEFSEDTNILFLNAITHMILKIIDSRCIIH